VGNKFQKKYKQKKVAKKKKKKKKLNQQKMPKEASLGKGGEVSRA
jgi:hypothetical protein